VNRASAGGVIVLALVAVGFAIAVMLARATPASQEHTRWRGALDVLFGRDTVAAGGDEEERPPIVVRSGSLYIDGGDPLNPAPKWRGWTLVSTSSGTATWTPDQPAGAPVRAFEVTALNVIGTPAIRTGAITSAHARTHASSASVSSGVSHSPMQWAVHGA